MPYYSDPLLKQRRNNASGLAAFGVMASGSEHTARYRSVREAGKTTIFTIGYEKRSGDELVSLLRDAGIDVLVDVREKAISRKPDFRASALSARCEQAGLKYEKISGLGSTQDQRDALKASGDIRAFQRRFKTYAKRYCKDALEQAQKIATNHSIALLCYERCHEDCHRSSVAELLADRMGASIVAIT